MRRLTAFLLFLCAVCAACPARAQSLSLISDEETEAVLASWLTPVFKAAGLDASRMEIHLVKDGSINAFAAKGLHVFIHTGLIVKADNAQEIIAVLAHETGHIAGGHIVRLYENMRIAQRNMLVSALLASVAGAAAGRSDVGAAAWAAGSASAQNLLMGYRRTEENAADQSAVTYLRATGHDLTGFHDIMKKLQAQENLVVDPATHDVLWRTHPDIKDRLAFILNESASVPPANAKKIAAENAQFERIRAKLYAYLSLPEKTLNTYPPEDKSLPARYARTIACYKSGALEKAQKEIDSLIADYPDDPFFYELKGQMLFETGHAAKAVPAYARAVALRPRSVLLNIGYAQALTESENPADLRKAVGVLEKIASVQPDSPFVWRLAAIAYGRAGRTDKAVYAQAEYAFLTGDDAGAARFANKALQVLPPSDAAYMRAQDVLNQLKSRRKNGGG